MLRTPMYNIQNPVQQPKPCDMQDLVAALDACSARQLHLNPVTAAAGAKCLSGVAAAECQELSPAEAKQLAAESAGDLRHAIGMLQMLLCGTAPALQAKGRKVRRMRLPEANLAHKSPRPFNEFLLEPHRPGGHMPPPAPQQYTCCRPPIQIGTPPPSAQGAAAKRKRLGGQLEPPLRSTAFTGRDQGLTLFHALGKLLYNKRLDPADPAQPSTQPASSASQGALNPDVREFGSPSVAVGRLMLSSQTTGSQPSGSQSRPGGGSGGGGGVSADVIDLTDILSDEPAFDTVQPAPPDIHDRRGPSHSCMPGRLQSWVGHPRMPA